MTARIAWVFLLGLCQASYATAQSAADAFYDPAEMAKARSQLHHNNGGQINTLVIGERLEYQSNDGDALAVWEGHGWVGSDLNKFWVKTEGEYVTDGDHLEEAELQALYSRAIKPFWDLQAGVRYDFRPNPSRSYAVVGVTGLAPYWFELDSALFLSEEGDVSARLEVEYELLITQRLILQPRVELNGAFSNDKEIGVGSGLSTADAGVRLRYEVIREFAPYVGLSWSRSFGNTQDFQRAAGEDVSQWSLVAGVRFWY
jgi:copper resistance protein B